MPSRGLSVKRLKQLKHESKLAVLRERAAFHSDGDPALSDPFHALIHGDRARLSGRPREHDDRFWAQLAVDYEEAAASGRPVKELATQYHLSEGRIRDLVSVARRREFLTKAAGRGVAGGRATAKARRLSRERS